MHEIKTLESEVLLNPLVKMSKSPVFFWNTWATGNLVQNTHLSFRVINGFFFNTEVTIFPPI